jgi:hypothetical protein
MNFRNETVSLDLSEQLYNTGIPQKSLYYWGYESSRKNFVFLTKNPPMIRIDDGDECNISCIISAFTVSELLEMIPAQIQTEDNAPFDHYYLNIEKRMNEKIQYIVSYICDSCSLDGRFNKLIFKCDHSLPDALSLMLLWLKESNFV